MVSCLKYNIINEVLVLNLSMTYVITNHNTGISNNKKKKITKFKLINMYVFTIKKLYFI